MNLIKKTTQVMQKLNEKLCVKVGQEWFAKNVEIIQNYLLD